MSAAPRLVVDLDVLERNIETMAARGRRAGLPIRPHAKTHKIPRIAAMQRDAGARGFTLATIGEAEVFAAAGFDDLFIAYPLWVDAEDGARLARLSESAQITVGCDNLDAARSLRRHTGTASLRVLIEVDSGQHRSGVTPGDAGELAAAVAGLGLDVVGAFTFPGHSYAREARGSAAQDERAALSLAAQAMRAKGVEPNVRSGGSSPSMAFVSDGPSVSSAGTSPTSLTVGEPAPADAASSAPTEMRPGAYVFNDAQQWELGACTAEDIALTAHGTVVSHAGGRLVVNAGSKVLAPDKAVWATGHGRLLDHPDARIVQLSEHHAVVDMGGSSLPALGSTVRLVPNHCCNAINYADEVDVVQDGRRLDTWAVAARGLNG